VEQETSKPHMSRVTDENSTVEYTQTQKPQSQNITSRRQWRRGICRKPCARRRSRFWQLSGETTHSSVSD